MTEDKGLVSAATFKGATISDDPSGVLDIQVLDHSAAPGNGSTRTCRPMTRSMKALEQEKPTTSDLGVGEAAHNGDWENDPERSSRVWSATHDDIVPRRWWDVEGYGVPDAGRVGGSV